MKPIEQQDHAAKCFETSEVLASSECAICLHTPFACPFQAVHEHHVSMMFMSIVSQLAFNQPLSKAKQLDEVAFWALQPEGCQNIQQCDPLWAQ